MTPCDRYRGAEVTQAPALPAGKVPGGHQHLAPEGVDRILAERVADRSLTVVVNPWRGPLIPIGADR